MYLALARKYRPQRFAELIGQNSISRTLQNAITLHKVYPALIFSGMKGVGKTSTARILAKALNCEKGPAVEPCNECSTCREITEDISTDYLEIDGASNNGVNEVRSLRETVKYKPLRNRFRVVVIDEVHMLSGAAWNALLKTIEEPPEHTIFIMATTDFHKIPATIVSRSQHFEFKRIPLEVIKTVLADICKKENIKISDYALFLVSRAAEGSLRDAKKILDQAIAISGGDVKDGDIIEILGIIDEDVFLNLTRCVFEQDRKGIIAQIDQLNERGIDLRFFYNEYLKFFRDLIVIKSVKESDKLHNLNPENVPRIREMIKMSSEIELLRYFNTLKEMDQTIKNSENPSIFLELLFLKLSFFPSLAAIEEIIKKMKDPRPEPVETPFPSSTNPSVEEKRFPSMVSDTFVADVKKKIEGAKPRMASVLGSSSLFVKDGILYIEIPPDMENAWKMVKDSRTYIREIAGELSGREMGVEIVLRERKNGEDEKEKIQKLRDDKVIKSLKDMIKGKVIAIENFSGGKDE